ncbi:BfmA/BtgA family mobilization protein [Winogradskyella ursingii]|uniref:BfmA/BtgA family mobilization protein n=1 Tax=Winogradskyella ursingii TaxID=2686079 RepID=UPI0015C88C73|nr:BfmA/BtgA family mobilization protein [Winogradskyella ursingii]
MDKGYENERFEKLGIKASVAEKFRDFCKKISKSQSMTLLLMLEFFEDNGISPAESMGPRMETLESKISTLIKKRMNGMIAIMKDIEKSQTKPTVAMLYSLFEQTEPPKKKLILEKKYVEKKDKGFQEKSIPSKNKDGEWKR